MGTHNENTQEERVGRSLASGITVHCRRRGDENENENVIGELATGIDIGAQVVHHQLFVNGGGDGELATEERGTRGTADRSECELTRI